MRYLIFDIETVPQAGLDAAREEEVARRTELEVAKGRRDQAEADSLIRSISPFFGRILAIGMRLFSEGSSDLKDKVICETDEAATLGAFLETINHSASSDLRFIHYNGLGFDIPFIINRAIHLELHYRRQKCLS